MRILLDIPTDRSHFVRKILKQDSYEIVETARENTGGEELFYLYQRGACDCLFIEPGNPGHEGNITFMEEFRIQNSILPIVICTMSPGVWTKVMKNQRVVVTTDCFSTSPITSFTQEIEEARGLVTIDA